MRTTARTDHMSLMIDRTDRERMQLRVETDELGSELEQLAKAKVRHTEYISFGSGFGRLLKSLSNDISVIKFSCRFDMFFPRYEPDCGKMQYITMLKNPCKMPGCRSHHFSLRNDDSKAVTVNEVMRLHWKCA